MNAFVLVHKVFTSLAIEDDAHFGSIKPKPSLQISTDSVD